MPRGHMFSLNTISDALNHDVLEEVFPFFSFYGSIRGAPCCIQYIIHTGIMGYKRYE